MVIKSEYSQQADTLKISISGDFTYDLHQQFTSAYKSLPASGGRKYIIDLSRVEYMDSAALGMLLLLRERVGNERANITLSGASKNVKNILDISGFEQLFRIT